jgi:transcriptional regulator with XRE-family HTH domain
MNGEELKKRRLDAGLTQEELAEKLGTYKQKISNWENGVYKISRLYLIAIEKALSKN